MESVNCTPTPGAGGAAGAARTEGNVPLPFLPRIKMSFWIRTSETVHLRVKDICPVTSLTSLARALAEKRNVLGCAYQHEGDDQAENSCNLESTFGRALHVDMPLPLGSRASCIPLSTLVHISQLGISSANWAASSRHAVRARVSSGTERFPSFPSPFSLFPATKTAIFPHFISS